MVTDPATARDVAASVVDPELPVVTIEDLGMLRDVRVRPDNTVEVDITPTYSGCPALETIRSDIRTALQREGFGEVRVRTVLAPTWTTDWITEAGRRKLAEFGIAPPSPRGSGPVALELSVRCPRCGSTDTAETSRFGSTACKAIWRCRSCLETFDRVKPL